MVIQLDDGAAHPKRAHRLASPPKEIAYCGLVDVGIVGDMKNTVNR